VTRRLHHKTVLCNCPASPEVRNELQACSSRCWLLWGQQHHRCDGSHVWHNQHGSCHVEDGAPALGGVHRPVDAVGGAEHEHGGSLEGKNQH
jgi:hypothetical protein